MWFWKDSHRVDGPESPDGGDEDDGEREDEAQTKQVETVASVRERRRVPVGGTAGIIYYINIYCIKY